MTDYLTTSRKPVTVDIPYNDNIHVVKQISPLTRAIIDHTEAAQSELMRITNISDTDRHELPGELYGCIFIGHIATDMDRYVKF
jgi:hypothetical protein